ncbi:hypothetical protein F383_06638 [Gossypium arboreum]|uniref:Uncharacterized protein n=1 Tax=Gossypium arboreum TaxID=29729 RepID=A0A0B0PDX7_GOSAR|nr:hypothetical protein F383_06638 [Gossypium arboreum]
MLHLVVSELWFVSSRTNLA